MTMYNVVRDAAKKVGMQSVGERPSLLWTLSEKRGVRKEARVKTYFDEDLKGLVVNQVQERLVWWEGLAASLADALRICREKFEKGHHGGTNRAAQRGLQVCQISLRFLVCQHPFTCFQYSWR